MCCIKVIIHDGIVVDVLATAMRFGGKVTDLTKLELCYAPPFGSAKDPVNIAGYVAENIISGICVIYVCAICTLGGNGKCGIRAQGVAEPLGYRFTI